MDNLRFSSAPTADSIDASIAQHYPDCEPVAVIGYACHFPESPDGETFWQNLLEGRECSRRFTREELLAVGLDAAIIDDPHYVNIGTVLDNADCFDATLFGYSRQEAESMDPQQRLFLQAVCSDPIVVPVENCGIFRADKGNENVGLNPSVDLVLIHRLRNERNLLRVSRGIVAADIRRSVRGGVVVQQNIKRILGLLHKHALDCVGNERRVVMRRQNHCG